MNETTIPTATPDGLALLQEWQHRLGLDDWSITLHDNCHPEEMDLADVSGDVTWTEVNRSARIEILDGSFYGDRVRPFDYEKTLVHELLHLKTSFISDQVDPLQVRIAHQLIEDLARALVDAKRCCTDGILAKISSTAITHNSESVGL